MSVPARRLPEPQSFTIRWSAEDWDRIVQAAEKMASEYHMDVTPTDIIRSGTRRMLDELAPQKSD